MILAISVAGCLTTDYGAESDLRASQVGIGQVAAEVKDQVSRCWALPAGAVVPLVKVQFQLKRDGTLVREPVVLPVNSGDLQNAQFQLAAKSATRAIRTCTPLRLPADRYDVWENIEMVFDPRVAHR